MILNYDILGKHYHALREHEWDLVVLDESQSIKNPAAKRTLQIVGYTPSKKRQSQGEKVIERLPGRRRVALSGTPIENNVQDLWCVLNYLDPQTWPSYWAFGQRYAGMVKDMGRFIFTGPTNTEELQRRLRSTCMIRRLKSDVLKELPPITRMIHELDPSGLEQFVRAEQSAYRAQEKGLFDGQVAVELARCGEDDGAFRAAVKNLNQSAFGFDELAKVRAETAFAMVDKVLPVLDDEIEEAGKAIIFGHHRKVLEKLHSSLKGSVMVTGETPIEQRQRAVDRFQTDPACTYFIGSTRACGEGITLTAATTVYFVEGDWAPSKISQAESRPHRIGQTKNVLVKHFIVPGTINARMINVCIEKQEMIEKTLDIDPDVGAEPLFVPYRALATRRELQAEAMLIETREISEIHQQIKAKTYTEGMNEIDRRLCSALAGMETITQGQAALARRLLARYKGLDFPRKAPEPQTELFAAH